ncbi:MAG: M13 family metallopeptidase [Cellulosilyticaceae bacterium]
MKKKKFKIVSLCVLMSLFAQSLCAAKVIDVETLPVQARLQDDFYEATNREWLQNAQIKPGYVEQSTFNELSDQADEEIKVIFESLLHTDAPESLTETQKKMLTLYENVMNDEERNKQGMQPIRPYLQALAEAQTPEDLLELLGQEQMSLFNSLVSFQVTPDLRDSTHHMLEIGASNLFLGDPDEYTKPSKDTLRKEKLLRAYLEKLLVLGGYGVEEAEQKIDNTFAFEQKLAPFMWGQEAITQEDSLYEKIYNVHTFKELEESSPDFNINNLMKSLGYDQAKKIVLQEPKWLDGLNQLYTKENLPIIKDYLEVHLFAEVANYLGKDLEKATQHYVRETYGVEGEIPKEQIARDRVSSVFTDELGKLYISKHFSEEEKQEVEKLVGEIIDQYKIRLKNLDWMSKKTKKNAIKKLEAITVKVGYPKEWEEYEGLEIKSYKEGGSLLKNMMEVALFNRKQALEKINKKVDKEAFAIPVQMVNAVYSPNNNDITFPAAILQAPLYDSKQSLEANLGGIGAVIGHEITHAFDPTGAKFDEDGNLKEWWSEEDYKKFEEKTKRVKAFYNNIELFPGYKVNGDLTVGENIADIGGISTTLDLVEGLKEPNYKDFFEAWAKVWRLVSTPEYQIEKLKTDVHAPHKVRVNAVLQQFEQFYGTYNITEKNKMYIKPEERLSIW